MSETIDRQSTTGSSQEERVIRESETRELMNGFIVKNADYFNDPVNRLEFISLLDADHFFKVAQYANAKLRGEKPHELLHNNHEKGGYLSTLHTPSEEDKMPAFVRGYQAIQEYIDASQDSTDKKIEGAAMAIEALIIWDHPFNDGNGRTSRFLASMIENGASDPELIIEQTAFNQRRGRQYLARNKAVAHTKESQLAAADNEDFMYDDDERIKMRATANDYPSDIDAMYENVKHLLENEAARSKSTRFAREVLGVL